MKDRTILGVVAILCLTVLESVALLQGINGSLLTIVVFAVGTIAGYEMKAVMFNGSRR